ncbi:MAG: outer membrane protein assembly factor BamD [Neomegalonema sp.]|nr:outer membrane protein assembly factor BamD [Neomegalonema sp.]
MIQSLHLCSAILRRFIVLLALTFGLASCGAFGGPTVEKAPVEKPAKEMYAAAEAKLKSGDLKAAVKAFDEVERLHPTSQYAKRAILASATASYKNGDYDKAIVSAERYLSFYPSDKKAPEAQYLVALSHYDQITDVGRDQNRTKRALQALRTLIARYPTSQYRKDAQLKIELALDHLAGKEMEVGRFYLKRGQYIAAINRFRLVVVKYQRTAHTAEALHRLVEAYLALGVVKEAQTAAAILGHNFPGSPWYLDSYALLTGKDLRPKEDKGSWISRSWGKAVDAVDIF